MIAFEVRNPMSIITYVPECMMILFFKKIDIALLYHDLAPLDHFLLLCLVLTVVLPRARP